MKYKVGDKVRIKSRDWYNENKTPHGDIWFDNTIFVRGQSLYCGCELTIHLVTNDSYYVIENNYYWTDEMIEGLVEEEIDLIPKFGEFSDNEPLDIPTMTTEFVKEHGFPCPEGFIFKDENGNVINATKIVLEKKKKEYPKTYEECKYILGITTPMIRPDYNGDLIVALQKLLICRNAYWKIAGEEMGLGKPWELSIGTPIYYIYYNRTLGTIKKDYADDIQGNVILAFPTVEMRDAFYENFKELIESCKEFL